MTAILENTLQQGSSDQYECTSVTLDAPTGADEVIAFAREIGAERELECGGDKLLYFIINFTFIAWPDRISGPRAYTEGQVRSLLSEDPEAALAARKLITV